MRMPTKLMGMAKMKQSNEQRYINLNIKKTISIIYEKLTNTSTESLVLLLSFKYNEKVFRLRKIIPFMLNLA